MEFVRESKTRLLQWQDRQVATIPNLVKGRIRNGGYRVSSQDTRRIIEIFQ
jgi:hypothetical protein